MGIARQLSIAIFLALLQATPTLAECWLPLCCNHSKTAANGKHGAMASIPVVSSVSNGTKKVVNQTTSFLSPKKNAPTRTTGTTKLHSSKPKSEQPGFWARMFKSEPPPPPRTVEEWMRLKQIKY